MTVLERAIKAGFDPAKADEFWGNGSVDCEEIEVKMHRCKPDGFTEAVMVRICGCHPYTDGTIRPAPSWYGDEMHMVFAPEAISLDLPAYPIRF